MDAPPPAPLGLSRTRRIKQGRDFNRAKEKGRRLAQGCLILNWLDLPAEATSRVGVITGRRLGNAVVRSRARRLLREAFRLNQLHLLRPVDLVLVARLSIVGKPFAAVANDYRAALKRAGLFQDPARNPARNPSTNSGSNHP